VTLIALPALMEQLRESGHAPSPEAAQALLGQVALYNPLPAGEEVAYLEALAGAYAAFWAGLEVA
jgi:hypothetical protein